MDTVINVSETEHTFTDTYQYELIILEAEFFKALNCGMFDLPITTMPNGPTSAVVTQTSNHSHRALTMVTARHFTHSLSEVRAGGEHGHKFTLLAQTQNFRMGVLCLKSYILHTEH